MGNINPPFPIPRPACCGQTDEIDRIIRFYGATGGCSVCAGCVLPMVQDKPEYLMTCSHNSSIEYPSVYLFRICTSTPTQPLSQSPSIHPGAERGWSRTTRTRTRSFRAPPSPEGGRQKRRVQQMGLIHKNLIHQFQVWIYEIVQD